MISKGPADYYKEGSNNVRCQECGRKKKAEDVRKRWDGFLVCDRCFEIRHPQDYVRGVPDGKPPAVTTSDPPWIFDGVIPPPGLRVINSYIFGGQTLG